MNTVESVATDAT